MFCQSVAREVPLWELPGAKLLEMNVDAQSPAESPPAEEARYLGKGRKEFQKRNYAVAVLYFENAAA
jgi:hypothetical protein